MSAHDLHVAPVEVLRRERTSVKWANMPEDVIPMFIAEMDFTVAEPIREVIKAHADRSDLGYAGDLGELFEAFTSFADARWEWRPDPAHFFVAPDVSFGVKAALRQAVPRGGTVALATPVYPSFFGYLNDLGMDCVEIPLIEDEGGEWRMDIAALEAAFAEGRVDALILSNPHNPHGIAHTRQDLEGLAQAAANHGVFIVSDEIHAPLTHHGVTFTPFAPIAAARGVQSVTVTSASKGWNIAGTKCALVYAPPEIASAPLRNYLEVSLSFSASILGRSASTVAFRDGVPWLDAAITQIERNARLLNELLKEHLPGARLTVPRASYLAWMDLRDAGLGADPWRTIRDHARVLTNDGATFGRAGEGHVRMNIGCAPDLIREAVARMAASSAA